MLLDLRILLTACFAAVLLLIGGFGLIAALRTSGKPSIEVSSAPSEITGSIGLRHEKPQSLTDDDKNARPAQPAAESGRSATEPVRAVNLDKTEKPEITKSDTAKGAEEDKSDTPRRAAARPRPRIVATSRQDPGANFRANNPFLFPFFAPAANTNQ
ncbi:MAG TPA: hypothetical protein VKT73_09960 [Xanthobacteraceae bacterium]|nr:hypothetical protein [Xanthobacteraceae bacterium]